MLSSHQTLLPALRDDLTIAAGMLDESGRPTWIIYDALSHRHYRIDDVVYEVLGMWRDQRTVADLIAAISARGAITVSSDDIAKVIAFLKQHKLCRLDEDGAWEGLSAEQRQFCGTALKSLLHNYLFFKLPIWRPQSSLQRTLPTVRKLFTPQLFSLIATFGVVGLYLASRQWEEFVSAFQYAFRWEGALAALICVVIVKCCHELAHAYAAVHYGCRVPSMGIAFMMFAPMLYADVSDSWKLSSRQQRIHIALAGIVAELALASIALLLWSFLGEGPLRSTAFFVAVISLSTSLLINLNPLMRFDGYHILSDVLGVDNLQDRAFALARWKMREILFNLELACPDSVPRGLRRVLICFAWATWIYRFGLFLGIALLVYHYFFKALGLALFIVEIWYFILLPVYCELRCWWDLRADILRRNRWVVMLTVVLAFMITTVVPWSTHVDIAAVVEPKEFVRVFPVRSAVVRGIHVVHGQRVEAGQPILSLQSPELDKDIVATKIHLRSAQLQYARRIADDVDREATLELERRISGFQSKIAGLEIEREELEIRSPIKGEIAELGSELHVGRWVNSRVLVATVVKSGALVARGYVAEEDAGRIVAGSPGTFFPEAAQLEPANGHILDIGLAGTKEIEIADLTSQYSGRIAVQSDQNRRLVPVAAHYPVRFELANSSNSLDLIRRGTLVVSGRPESFLGRTLSRFMIVLIRESGF